MTESTKEISPRIIEIDNYAKDLYERIHTGFKNALKEDSSAKFTPPEILEIFLKSSQMFSTNLLMSFYFKICEDYPEFREDYNEEKLEMDIVGAIKFYINEFIEYKNKKDIYAEEK